jgi:hypothetical protein
MIKIAHIINPVIVPESSDLFYAQPVTFETIRRAKEFAQNEVNVQLYTAQYPEDKGIISDFLSQTPDLDRSILDEGNFSIRRKLPLIKDILDRLHEAAGDADYLIYTNVDIALMPYFYAAVAKIIDSGYDAFVINRRTISSSFTTIEEIPLMYSQVGEIHPGHDCFVFKRELYPKFEMDSTVCIGVNWVGRALILNLAANAEKFAEFQDKHLTFHIGKYKIWKNEDYLDYVNHNKKEILQIIRQLKNNNCNFDANKIAADYLSDIFPPMPDGVISEDNPSFSYKVKSVANSIINSLKSVF